MQAQYLTQARRETGKRAGVLGTTQTGLDLNLSSISS